MTQITTLPLTDWHAAASAADQDHAVLALESGGVLCLPRLPFVIEPAEQPLLSADLGATAKNISLSADGSSVRGVDPKAVDGALLQGLLQRYASHSRKLVGQLFPGYAAALQPGRTSFRPAEIAGRQTSWRKDDTRLHVDSFPSSPTAGWRILRVFSNVHPGAHPRTWRLGEPFEQVARRYRPALRGPLPGSSALLHALGLTKQRRTAYDHFMLRLHDLMKADLAYQASVTQSVHEFAPGSTWLVFTDQASHAATGGQFALEQTLLLPPQALREPARSPLRVLEGLLGRSLV